MPARILMLMALVLVGGLLGAQAANPGARSKPKEPTQPPKASDTLKYVKVETSMGDFILELNETRAPITVRNFLSYVDKGFYNGTIFHRVEHNFVIQGGGYTPDMKLKPTEKPIKNEGNNGLRNMKYAVSMARTSALDSATAQFFINMRWNTSLDADGSVGPYAVFGRVIRGQDVIDSMNEVRVMNRDGAVTFPAKTIEIKKASRISADEVPAENAEAEGQEPAGAATSPSEQPAPPARNEPKPPPGGPK